jgi:type III pantothenate kinase
VLKTRSQRLIGGTYDTLGVDRVANIAAAWKLFAGEAPAMVLDLGTATTLTAVSPDGRFAGGLITLGLGKTLAALHANAAALPDIRLEGRPPHTPALAFNTETAIASGAALSHVGLVEYWIKLARKQLGPDTVTVATGGWAETLARYTRAFDHIDPYLTLKGIYLIAEAEAALADPA